MHNRVRRIDLVELRGLCVAVELGSLGRAAEAMGISQPAMSKRMRELETLAGARLLARSPRGVSPTAAGERLYREARALLAHAEAVESVLDGLRDRPAPIRLAASHTIAEFVLPRALAAVRRRAGRTPAVELVAANSAVVRDLVRERRFDLGLAAAYGEPAPGGLREVRLADDEVTVAVGADHPWAARAAVGLEEFLVTPMVMRDPTSNARRLLEDALRGRGLPAPPPLTEVGSTAAAITAALAGPAPAVLSRRAVDATPALRAVSVESLRLLRRFVLLTRDSDPLPGPVAELVGHLRQTIT
jgi:DNA-binding transcriptional LysR family regulator